MTDKKCGVAVPDRIVPFPTSISEEARAALERLVGPDRMPVNASYVMPSHDDVDAWMNLKATADARYAASLAERAGRPLSTVETIDVKGAVIHVAEPDNRAPAEAAYIDLHGGALVMGGGAACSAGAQMQADLHQVRCYAVDYRTPPEHPYPAALDDCVTGYRHVLKTHAPSNIIIGGRSAGGNLAAAMLLRAREESLPMPAALVLLSPQVDLTESGDSFEVNQLVDVVLPGSLRSSNLLYANGSDLTDPHLSPLFGELSGFPPTFLHTGTRDLFLSNTVRMHRALRRAGVQAELHVFEAMPHGGFTGHTAEDRDLSNEVARFVRRHWGAPSPVN
ncbi:alpha/beta hydrolase [Sphingomonas desiccabilis]|uniref:Alpha/beta hydrolase n=1 Tax=Sphingomonas desiccabilis TaxID=429134 RepID=A0A4Q2J1Z2_9SPHN|nr:alpha/beta hydrolase [Sphingomonas desiccabilis]MBB3910920.1 acetyl esterase/lipase [Sphingomonas desiccabilis]RXZ35511.1 alpha/beta hydrolase [Sphingomonas desiccabilis]